MKKTTENELNTQFFDGVIFKEFFDSSNDLFCIASLDGYFKYLNKSFITKLGYQGEELLDHQFLTFVHPDDREDTLEAVSKLNSGQAIFSFENRYLCKDGSYIWLDWTSKPRIEENLIYATARDITNFKFYQSANKKMFNDLLFALDKTQDTISSTFQNLIVEQLPEGLVLVNDKFEVLVYNRAFKDLYNNLYENKIEKFTSYESLLTVPNPNELEKTIIHLLHTKTHEVNFSPEPGLYLRIFHSYAEEYSLILLYDESKAVNLENIRQKVISTVSHELRTPVSAIFQTISNYKQFKTRLPPETIDKMWEILNVNATIMKDLVDDLLTLFQLTEKKITLKLQQCSMADIGHSIVNGLSPIIKEKNGIVDLHYEQDIHCQADQNRLAQVLRILLDNSLKYSKNQPNIDISFKQIVNDNNNECLQITVSDNGIGIPIEDQNNLFNRFYRASNVGDYRGTGIGLTIAKEIVEAHNGSISFSSEENTGTSFIILLPLTS